MLRRISGIAITFSIVAIAYTGYALLVVPWIAPPANANNDVSMNDTWMPLTPRHREQLAQFFPPGSWQLESPTIIESSYGILLFKQNNRTQETLEIKPCTLLVFTQQTSTAQDAMPGTSNKPQRRAYILDAPDGAVLEHEGQFDLNQKNSGRIIGGRLLGNVSIHSAATSADANDAVQITTRNIQIDRQRIWTPHDVKFQIGPHHGSGRDLVITLARISNPDQADQRPNLFNTIDSMELIQVDSIHLQLSRQLVNQRDQALPSPATTSSGPSETPLKQSTIPVEIRCQGPLRLDLRKQVASLEKHVDVLIRNPRGLVDQLTCQRLDLHFSPQRSSSLRSPGSEQPVPSPKQSDKTPAIEPVELVATGNPVILRAPSMGAIARAQEIRLQILNRQVLLRDSNQALIVQDNHQLVAPKIEYHFSPKPQQLGQFFATGPGRYEGKSRTAKRTEFMATWQEECRLFKEQDQHVFSLVGQAQVSQIQTGTVQADDLHIWFDEVPVVEPLAFKPSGNSQKTGSARSTSKMQYKIVPKKMAFRGNVQVNTQQLSAKTNLIEVWFREPIAAGTSNNQAPSPTKPKANPKPNLSQAMAKRKLNVSGDHIRLQVALPNPQPTITDLSVEGNVTLQQLVPAPANASGFQMQARSLQLKRYANGLFNVSVRGHEQESHPAEIQAGGMKLVGMNIQLDQQIPRIWIAGPGQMHLLQANKTKPEEPASQTQISWEKQLNFDGRMLTLEKNVETLVHSRAANGQSTRTQITGALLQTTLNRYLDLRQPERATNLQLKQLLYGGNVRIVSQTHTSNGQPLSVDQLHVHSMTLDQQTGDLQATGPGWGSSIRIQEQRNLAPNAKKPAERTLLPNSKSGLIYVRVDFENRIDGNLLKRKIAFSRHVHTLYGPVPGWNSVLNPNIPGGLGEQGIELRSDKLILIDTQQKNKPSILLEAVGNTRIKSQKYSAIAHRLTYAQSNSLLTLEGDRAPAKLRRFNNKTSEPDILAKKILYHFDDQSFEIVGGSRLRIN